ncbi:hypothetical protein PJ900_00580 (plasmid) [Tistrella mobilis]|uniref:hypothetical protein n=1 Tax=Tistrella mobilis TaxID=171437 RepID=UPI0035568E1A
MTENAPHCQRCGRLMIPHHDATTRGLICPTCGWSVVSTALSAVLTDDRPWRLFAAGFPTTDRDRLKALAEVRGINLVEAAKLVRAMGPAPDTPVFEGRASELVQHMARLREAGITVATDPGFPHDTPAALAAARRVRVAL